MYILNISNPLMIIFLLMFTVLMIIIGYEFKKSVWPGIMLGVYLIFLVMHITQLFFVGNEPDLTSILYSCITWDFIFIFLSFVSYLWIDDIEAKFRNKKSIDNSLEWFWKKV